MAKVYGDRWEVIRSLGEGGQARVFAVKDLRGEHASEMALKHLKNVKRRDRFIKEAKAGLRLQHDNIVKVIDHSTLGDDFDNKDHQFLVMPLAVGGALERRAELYKGSVDSTLLVAEHLASALAHAHAAETETGEVVGPREFIAPELLDGGQLDVTPAADLYSLGKVIYFMFSGGVVVARERHRERQYNVWQGGGIRSESLGFLLDRLICPVDRRIQTAADVIVEIRRIRELDHRPGVSPVSPKAQSLVAGLVAGQQEERSSQEHNAAVAKGRRERFARYRDSLSVWVKSELATQAKGLSTPGAVEITTETFASPGGLAAGFPKLHKLFEFHLAWGLSVKLATESQPHSLVFFLGTMRYATFTSGGRGRRVADDDIPVSFLPYYAMGDGKHTHGFLGLARRARGAPAVHETFTERGTMVLRSTAEKWPTDQHEYKAIIDGTLETGFDFIRQTQTGTYTTGP